MPQELQWLAFTLLATALFALPYVLNRVAVRGLRAVVGNPSPQQAAVAPWAERAQRAHANAVENLVVFAPAVLAVVVQQRGDALTAAACATYFFARLAHYVVHALGVPVLRTLAYLAGLAATLLLVGRAAGVL